MRQEQERNTTGARAQAQSCGAARLGSCGGRIAEGQGVVVACHIPGCIRVPFWVYKHSITPLAG